MYERLQGAAIEKWEKLLEGQLGGRLRSLGGVPLQESGGAGLSLCLAFVFRLIKLVALLLCFSCPAVLYLRREKVILATHLTCRAGTAASARRADS